MKKLFIFLVSCFISQYCFAQWEADFRLTDDPFTSTNYSKRGLASSGDTVHMVWSDDRDGNYEIYYKRSVDGEQTWGNDVRLTNRPFNSQNAAITVSGSTVHVVWNDDGDLNYEIYYKCSEDGGDSWGEDFRLTDTPGLTQGPSITSSGSNIYLVYYDESEGWWEIFFQRSTDGGLTWEPAIRLTEDQAVSGNPSVCAVGPIVHVVWNDNRDMNKEIYYSRSEDEGETWDEETRLTIADYDSWVPDIAAYESDVYIVWVDGRDWDFGYYFTEIYFKHSSDGGLTWGEDTRLTNYAGNSEFPNLAVCGDGIFIVWQDNRIGNLLEIYYKYSFDGGDSWEPDTRLTYDPADSFYPFVSVSGTQVNVTWTDFRDGNYEIYYKRDPTGNLNVGIEEVLMNSSAGPIYVYPNPASRQLTVSSQQSAVSGQRSAVRLSIVDLYGREIKEFEYISSFPYRIDISDLWDGLYILRVESEEGKSGSAKFLKIDE
ncbi:MAG: exo-alpha-sialidase [Bacteroidales bacterium]|nr:exo-alpha-sialidase [Bacteroidales bacterium]